MTPLDRMILGAVRCVKCGAAYGACDCWERCSCGWTAEKGKSCGNPETTHCSTKLKYGRERRKWKAG
jgi:hypothetical protein